MTVQQLINLLKKMEPYAEVILVTEGRMSDLVSVEESEKEAIIFLVDK